MGHFNEALKLLGSFHGSTKKQENDTLDHLVEQAKKTSYTSLEQSVLASYGQTLTSGEVTESALKNRLYLCKILLLETRDQPRCGKMYRSTCDHILPLFSKPEAKLYFLDIARAFYPFWMKVGNSLENSNTSDGPGF